MRRFEVQRVSQDPKLRVDGFESLQVVWEGAGASSAEDTVSPRSATVVRCWLFFLPTR